MTDFAPVASGVIPERWPRPEHWHLVTGRVEFPQLVGITEHEADLMKQSTTADVLGAMARENQHLITDPGRFESIR